MRAVIYARYSSENQREASIEDHLEVCRRYVERQGWKLTGTYEDAAISGASRFRPGFTRLLADAETRRFDVVVCEAVDRLGRKLADVADFHDRLTFQRVQIHTTSMGLITPMHVGIMGIMAQMTLSDLREKTKRGQLAAPGPDASPAASPTATRWSRRRPNRATPASGGSSRPRRRSCARSSGRMPPASRPGTSLAS